MTPRHEFMPLVQRKNAYLAKSPLNVPKNNTFFPTSAKNCVNFPAKVLLFARGLINWANRARLGLNRVTKR
jgi:hypothetical protein